jgi:hypothetical protein
VRQMALVEVLKPAQDLLEEAGSVVLREALELDDLIKELAAVAVINDQTHVRPSRAFSGLKRLVEVRKPAVAAHWGNPSRSAQKQGEGGEPN